VRKFLFENDFDAVAGAAAGSAAARPDAPAKAAAKSPAKTPAKEAVPPAPVEPPPPPEPSFSEAELKAAVDKARAEGQRSGEAKGRAAAAAEAEQRSAAALEAIVGQVTALQAGLAHDRAAVLADASALALAILRKMLPEYSRRGGIAEIETVLEQCLRDQRHEPRLVARVAPDLVPLLEPRLGALNARTAFEGRLFLIPDDRLGPADCVIEWADGGLERHADALWGEITAALERCLRLQGVTPSPAPGSAAVTTTDEVEPAGNLAAASDAEAMRSE
jgi:flagellar assembly protein FliH